MGAKRKLRMTKDGLTLEFKSFSEAREYFGLKAGRFPSYCLETGWYKGWKVEADGSPFHGMHGTSMYRSWAAMKTRCTNPNATEWGNYGGRGISLYSEWMEFIPFMKWAKANGYKDGLTIERKDVNGDYCPSNCCWIPRAEQARNTTRTTQYTMGGKTKTLSEWAREYGMSRATVTRRIRDGWGIKDALTIKPQNSGMKGEE